MMQGRQLRDLICTLMSEEYETGDYNEQEWNSSTNS